eukprot:s247_g21.t1
MPPKFVFKNFKKTSASASAKSSSASLRASKLSPKAAATSSKAKTEAPVEMSLLKYINQAGHLLPSLPEPLQSEALWQIQLRHDARPSLLMKTVLNFNLYLAELHNTQADVPANLQDLRDEGILLSIANSATDNASPLVQWRVAFYVAGDGATLTNALHLIHGFLQWRKSHPGDGEPPFPGTCEVQMLVPTALQAQLAQEDWANNTRVSMPPRFGPFQAAAPTGHHLNLIAEFDGDGKTFQATFQGATWPFRQTLEANGVFGARTNEDQYVRVVAPTDVSQQEHRNWFLGTILRDTLAEMVIGLQIVQRPIEDSPAADFLGLLMDRPQIYLLQ